LTELHPVHLVGLPLDVMQRSAEHSDELLREFALIRGVSGDHVPARLLALIEELRGRFGAFAAGPRQAMQDAMERGEATIDLRYEVPAEVGTAARRLSALLDEADEFCRAGDLLTLATSSEVLAFRRWFLDQFQLQIEGRPPQAWSSVVIDSGGPG
jgi:hypothetical protein